MKTVLSLAALLFFSASAVAEPYVFAGVGAAKIQAAGISGNEPMARFGFGYQFSKYLGAEGSYVYYQSLNETARSGPSETRTRWKASGFGLSAVGTLPMSDSWSALATAGAQYLKSETNVVFLGGIGGANDSETYRSNNLGWVPAFGIGAQYTLGGYDGKRRIRAMLEQVQHREELDRVRSFTLTFIAAF